MQTLFKFATACALSLLTATASEIQFTQDGWSTGAILNVSFSGLDQNNDGTIIQTELASFSADWTSPLTGSTRWSLDEIQPDGFFFTDLDNYLVFLTNADFSFIGTAFEGEALASVFDSFLFPVDSSATPAVATPEPGGLALITSAAVLVGLIGWLRSGRENREDQ